MDRAARGCGDSATRYKLAPCRIGQLYSALGSTAIGSFSCFAHEGDPSSTSGWDTLEPFFEQQSVLDFLPAGRVNPPDGANSRIYEIDFNTHCGDDGGYLLQQHHMVDSVRSTAASLTSSSRGLHPLLKTCLFSWQSSISRILWTLPLEQHMPQAVRMTNTSLMVAPIPTAMALPGGPKGNCRVNPKTGVSGAPQGGSTHGTAALDICDVPNRGTNCYSFMHAAILHTPIAHERFRHGRIWDVFHIGTQGDRGFAHDDATPNIVCCARTLCIRLLYPQQVPLHLQRVAPVDALSCRPHGQIGPHRPGRRLDKQNPGNTVHSSAYANYENRAAHGRTQPGGQKGTRRVNPKAGVPEAPPTRSETP